MVAEAGVEAGVGVAERGGEDMVAVVAAAVVSVIDMGMETNTTTGGEEAGADNFEFRHFVGVVTRVGIWIWKGGSGGRRRGAGSWDKIGHATGVPETVMSIGIELVGMDCCFSCVFFVWGGGGRVLFFFFICSTRTGYILVLGS